MSLPRTQSEVDAHNLRVAAGRARARVSGYSDEQRAELLANAVAAGHEGDLHDEIIDECNRRGWIALYSARHRRTTRPRGEADFIILGSAYERVNTFGPMTRMAPRVWFVECKTRSGKRSPEQMQFAAHAAKLGHAVHLVRSLAEFLEVVR